MPKTKSKVKRIVKKVAKRKVVKRDEVKKPDTTNMSRLQYEQSMMDPRFRAAMMGFNNPQGNAQQYMNHALHEQETKNNELTRQVAFQNDLANAKQAYAQLKDEVSTMKIKHAQELSLKNTEMELQRKKLEKEAMTSKWKNEEEIKNLRDETAAERQKYKDAQTRWKQKEDKMKEEHNKEMLAVQSKHNEEMHIIKEHTAKTQQLIDLQQQQHDNDMKTMQANHDKMKSEMILEFQNAINPIKEQTEAIKSLADIEQTRHQQQQDMLNKNTELIKAQITSEYGPQTIRLQEMADDLKRKDQILQAQSKAISELKNKQTEYAITKEQFKNQPEMIQMQHEIEGMKNQMAINRNELEQVKERERLKTEKALLEQEATPEQIEEHGAKVREQALKTAPLQISKRLAEQTHKANLEYEDQYSKLVELGAQALGEDFHVEDIGTPALNEKLKAKEVEMQKERANIAAQTERIQRQLEMQRGLENDRIEKAKAEAQLDTVMNHDGKYFKAIYAAGTEKYKLEQENKAFRTRAEQIQQLKENNEDLFIDNVHGFEEVLAQDKTGTLRRIAIEVSGGDHPDPRKLPEFLQAVKSMHENVETTLENMDPNRELMEPSEFNELVYQMDAAFKERGTYTADRRNQMSRNLQAAQNKIEQDKAEKMEMQGRIKQLEQQKQLSDEQLSIHKRVGQSLLWNASRPLRKSEVENEDGEVETKYEWAEPGARNTKQTTGRVFPKNDQDALPLTLNNLGAIIEETGVSSEDYLKYTDYDSFVNQKQLPNFVNPDWHPDPPGGFEELSPSQFLVTPTSSAANSAVSSPHK